jgi:hypothetical protein
MSVAMRVAALSGLALPGCVSDCLDQEADVTVVDTGDGVAEADERLAGEAGGKS